MSVTTTLGKLKAAEKGMIKIMNSELPIIISHNLSKGLANIRKELRFFEESRNNLIKKHASKEEDGNFLIEPGTENEKRFMKEFDEFMDAEVEIKITPIYLSQIQNISISPVDLESLIGTFVLEDEIKEQL